MAAEGHELAVHCWEHQPPWFPRPAADRHDLERALAAVRETAGTEPLWYRPPYGVLTATRWWAAPGGGLGLRRCCGPPGDATGRRVPDPTVCSPRARARLSGGATVLLHDSDRNSAPGSWRVTLAALPRLVALCRAASWRIGPLAEHGPVAVTARRAGGTAGTERSRRSRTDGPAPPIGDTGPPARCLGARRTVPRVSAVLRRREGVDHVGRRRVERTV